MSRIVRIEGWKTSKHMPILSEWLIKHSAYVPDETPAIGYMAYVNETPVAAGFLRMVEGNTAQFDGLTTNPDCSKTDRNNCIVALVDTVIDHARSIELDSVMMFTTEPCIIERAVKHYKFKLLPHAIASLSLKGA